jgi:maleylacetoacetate isomerase/maleylpyruvate isomerase
MAARITLYGYWRSSASHRVRIALALKGLEYDSSPVNLAQDEQLGDAYAVRTPSRLLPTLVYDGLSYTESVAILEFIEERHPQPPLLPSDIHGRARVRALVEMVNSGIQPLQNLRVLKRVSSDAEEQKAWAAHFNRIGLDSFERALEMNAREGVRGTYSFGATPTLADVFLVPQVVSALRFGIDVAALPRVWAAYQAAMQLDAFQRAAPERQADAPR